jgi:hypothetical protein
MPRISKHNIRNCRENLKYEEAMDDQGPFQHWHDWNSSGADFNWPLNVSLDDGRGTQN